MKRENERVYFEQNRESWDNRVAAHVQSGFYDVPGFLKGASSLTPIEQPYIGKVAGQRVLHLQCHFGLDTLSLSRLGAYAVGVDFSREAILEARRLAQLTELDAAFYECDVYSVPELELGLFDMVFVSYGALCWLPDLAAWAEVVAGSLKENGSLVLAEFHPTVYMFDFNTEQPAYSYFNTGKPYSEVETGTYADPASPLVFRSHCWSHSLDEVIGSIQEHGLQLTRFKEFDYSPYNCFPNMHMVGEGKYRFGSDEVRIPHVYLIHAIKSS